MTLYIYLASEGMRPKHVVGKITNEENMEGRESRHWKIENRKKK